VILHVYSRKRFLIAAYMTACALVDLAADELLKSLSETVEQFTDRVELVSPQWRQILSWCYYLVIPKNTEVK